MRGAHLMARRNYDAIAEIITEACPARARRVDSRLTGYPLLRIQPNRVLLRPRPISA
jgi:hypothetical protein